MIDLQHFFDTTPDLDEFHAALREALAIHFDKRQHGRSKDWDHALDSMPECSAENFVFNAGRVQIPAPQNTNFDAQKIIELLQMLKPWRKGPWDILGIKIDTEWRSDWKWQRLQPHITPLDDRQVLDIGTGNGYFLYRMLGEGAALALGIDPTRLFLYQFQLVQNLLPANNAHLLPLRSEHLPAFNHFDTVFSLGVLYHRRSPLDHISELLSFLRPGGELVLETLIVPGDVQTILVPTDRYAKMANVWFIPSTLALENLIRRAGATNVRTVDINKTSTLEQQSTPWMDFQSLSDYLDPTDSSLTIEGYPAPARAIVVANKPG